MTETLSSMLVAVVNLTSSFDAGNVIVLGVMFYLVIRGFLLLIAVGQEMSHHR